MGYKIIPLTSEPNQSFTCTIPVDGKNITLKFKFSYNDIAGYWWVQIRNAETNDIIIDGLPLSVGEYPAADLLGQFTYLGIGSATIVKTGNSILDKPGESELGSEFLLIWGDTID